MILWTSAGLPTLAHQIQTNQGVAATFHLEPKHQPKAGQPAKIWFALTRAGRQIIPLEACACQLQIYQAADKNQTRPILQPPLQALNVERYQGIPSATVTFPKSGIYRLQLTGKPKSGNLFRPFTFSYQVVVTR
jgi:hypothetical protein